MSHFDLTKTVLRQGVFLTQAHRCHIRVTENCRGNMLVIHAPLFAIEQIGRQRHAFGQCNRRQFDAAGYIAQCIDSGLRGFKLFVDSDIALVVQGDINCVEP